MPEGPSIVILKETLARFKGKKILKASGTAGIDMSLLNNKKIVDLKTWGKHFLICFDGFYVRIHLLMFGTYRVNERKDAKPRLSLKFKSDEVNFYTCSVQLHEEDVNEVYDWTVDIMNPDWNARKASARLKAYSTGNVCDALLDQNMFAGLGNIIKNEVLFRVRIHPETIPSALTPEKRRELAKACVEYADDFLRWKKAFVLKKHWLIIGKNKCPRCNVPVHKEYLGKTKRRTFFCNNCQVLYE